MKQRNGPGGRLQRAILVSVAGGSDGLSLRRLHGSAPREARRMVLAGLLAIDGKGEDARVRLTQAGRDVLFGAQG